MNRPLLLDLFCGIGGASAGYHQAGFDIIGVDIEPQPDYPFDFIHADALTIAAALPLAHLVNAIHASPPCQASCTLTKGTNNGRTYQQLIPTTRDLLAATGLPTVIENVVGAALRADLTLCGEMFDLDVIRHRRFETSHPITAPPHRPHRGKVAGWRHGQYHDGPYVAVYGGGGGKGTVARWQQAMGINWTDNRQRLAEAIPPAYTRHIGAQLRRHCGAPVDRRRLLAAAAALEAPTLAERRRAKVGRYTPKPLPVIYRCGRCGDWAGSGYHCGPCAVEVNAIRARNRYRQRVGLPADSRPRTPRKPVQ